MFVQVLQRALQYRVAHLQTVQRIAWLYLSQCPGQACDIEVDESYRQRPAYQEGALTDEPDLSRYDQTLGENNDHHPPESEDENNG